MNGKQISVKLEWSGNWWCPTGKTCTMIAKYGADSPEWKTVQDLMLAGF